MKENKKIVVYVDLDNTITDFMSGVRSFPPDVQAQHGVDENGKDHSDEIDGLFVKELKAFRKVFLQPGETNSFGWKST